MSETPRPPRVRVSGPPRRRTASPSRAGAIDAGTGLGGIYLGSLLREQLWLALRVLTVLVLTVGLLPLAFHLVPSLAQVEVAGMPLAWLLLGVLVYPFLVALGWSYVRRAERNERAFAELMSEAEE
ncbi:hypothetical protein GHK92_00130 [Nocardioides sp. dk4132]|uniref:hypothetical protein n=1 Tax=unclassified Nocardioides TaxID=2615069 RepID=UPI001295A52E|nr:MULTISPECIES: hypothetical protein [unclassified Nocardioides]MQW74271.1 hypothetical protein [Nocardioides sp. dk4132]QGA06228.1 hypothetical protein GFH29_01585 [Nocardioides sp. dk884]